MKARVTALLVLNPAYFQNHTQDMTKNDCLSYWARIVGEGVGNDKPVKRVIMEKYDLLPIEEKDDGSHKAET